MPKSSIDRPMPRSRRRWNVPVASVACSRMPLSVISMVSRDGGYDVAVPRELCAGKASASERFDVQHLATDVNEDNGSGPSLGQLTVAC